MIEYQGDRDFKGLVGKWQYDLNASLKYAQNATQKELIQSRAVQTKVKRYKQSMKIPI